MSNNMINDNVPKFITDIAAFLESDANNARISGLQKDANNLKVKIRQQELKMQQEYMHKLRQAVKDIPGFWPFTLLRNESIMTACTSKQDLDAFGYLADVELKQDPKDFRNFEIVFVAQSMLTALPARYAAPPPPPLQTFNENPYFSNKTLTKTYNLHPELEAAKKGGHENLEEALAEFDPEDDLVSVATKIDWKSPEKNLIALQPREIPTLDELEGPAAAGLEQLEGDMGSFFHFFTEEDDPMQLGNEIAGDILPQTIEYFLGMAGAGAEGSDSGFGSDSDDDDDEEDGGEAEAEIDLEEEEVKRPAKKAKRS
ncbi:hypothetical protein QFC21_003220 [Naganishia friedmannii]|uniref:Uncharacterized protein n=1 Tax=Naganishia friedmannii TaxID=89922 RepID=A0ACC2VSJ8_9TREE|nr:hypothetical protein QFC21_003220 [Naganishia friedmannii]